MVFEASTLNVPSTSVDSMRVSKWWANFHFLGGVSLYTEESVHYTHPQNHASSHHVWLFADKLNKLTHAQTFIKTHFKNENPWATP